MHGHTGRYSVLNRTPDTVIDDVRGLSAVGQPSDVLFTLEMLVR